MTTHESCHLSQNDNIFGPLQATSSLSPGTIVMAPCDWD